MMKHATLRNLMQDSLQLALMSLLTAGLVFQLGTHSDSLMPALAVLAFMTPMVASAAVQWHRDLRQRIRDREMKA